MKKAVSTLTVVWIFATTVSVFAQTPQPAITNAEQVAVSQPMRDGHDDSKSGDRRVHFHQPLPRRDRDEHDGSRGSDTDSLDPGQRGGRSNDSSSMASFPGVGASGFAPPDTNMAVGPRHILQTVNSRYAIYDKSGTLLAGPNSLSSLWAPLGTSNGCATNNGGDVIAQYDVLADRFIVTQLGGVTAPFSECIAISQTSDPAGAYYLYSYPFGSTLNDYPKFGVWPTAHNSAYLATYNLFDNGQTFVGGQLCAYDRAKMLVGDPTAQSVCFTIAGDGGFLPADLDGTTTPVDGTPGLFLNLETSSTLRLYALAPNFANPNASTLAVETPDIAVAGYSAACAPTFTCVPQLGTSQRLDSLGDRLMYRLAFRNFGDHEAMVVNHSVAAGSSVGVRWYELRAPVSAAGAFTLFQQGTFAPDSTYRWMGSAAMDRVGDLAIGYSASSSSIHPAIRYAGRTPGDPSGTLEQEVSLIEGNGSQTGGLSRWGDYTAMRVDPADDCTFWYTNEYLPADGSFNWNTFFGSFRFSSCAASHAVPNVVGATQAVATATITAAGFVVGAITTAASSTVPAGSVVSQNPVAGTLAAAGSAIDIVVSTGSASVAVPNVVNLTQAAATAAITGAGLVVGTVTMSTSTTVPSGSVISQSPAAGSQVALGSAINLVVSSGPPVLGVDKVASSDGSGTRTITGFSTVSPGELLVAFVGSDGPLPGTQTLTVSGGGLTWALVKRVNTQAGTAEIWQATAAGTLTNASITSTQANGPYAQSLTVVAFVGSGGVGTSAAANASTGVPSVTLTTTRAGSLVYGVGDDWDNAIARTLGSNQTLVHQFLATSGDTMWVQNRTGIIANAGTVVTINDIAPTTDRWNLAAVEILSVASLVSVPNIVSLTQAAATTAITSAGLTVGTITTSTSTTVPTGSVISQNPPAGSQVAPSSAVSFIVSSGPPVSVPNVVNLTQTAATTAITTAGLIVGTVTTNASTTVPAGSVISQSPVAGAQVAVGSSVNLVVSSGPPQVTVPNVVNLTQAAATTAITSVGLTVGTITTSTSTTVPAGSVISQNPIGGTQVLVGSAVTILVSSGPPVSVPNVVNLTQASAATAITSAGLTVGTITTSSSLTVPAGSVISQNPVAGSQVASGTAVSLVVSSGVPQVTVPNVVNLTQAAATTAITNAGLTVGVITTSASTTVPSGSVISQNPISGTQVASGSAISLVISTGPPQVTVPNVVNLTQAAATTAITNAGLIVGTVTTSASTTVPAGSVISQNPAAGAQITAGSAVSLVVSSGPPSANPTVDTIVFSDGSGSRTTPAINTSSAGDVLVAFAGSDGPNGARQTLTISGAGLTWTLVARSNTQSGTSEIWTAKAPGVLTNATVQSLQSSTGYHQSLTVVAFRNAMGVGASATANGASGAPSVTLTTTRSNALVYGVGNDWDRAIARTLGPNQVLAHQWVDTSTGDTYWVQNLSAAVATSGTAAQLNDTAPTTDRWNLAVVEVVP